MPREDVKPFYTRIATATAGILLALRNAGVQLDHLGAAPPDYEISRRFAHLPSLPPGASA
jgi:hypothetical protein